VFPSACNELHPLFSFSPDIYQRNTLLDVFI